VMRTKLESLVKHQEENEICERKITGVDRDGEILDGVMRSIYFYHFIMGGKDGFVSLM
jgi:hypothetical protein